jgi:nitroimidazol reductase NimA-like FMN-containing flavoprotein (pyridoxamine 5'-phosphate oxidase superfamily)
MTLDELGEYGMETMDDEEIQGFLSAQGTGVLGLPTDGAPYLLPLSFGFDGESTLYFTYLLGAESRKEELTARADAATFLVYDAPSAFNWESVVLTGTISAVPEERREPVTESAWRPDLFRRAVEAGEVEVYRFDVDEQVGIRHTGLPPAFEDAAGEH